VDPRAGLEGCEKFRPSPGFDPRTGQPVASYYTHRAIPANPYYTYICIYKRGPGSSVGIATDYELDGPG
jgi:hypothetical protein